MNAWRFMMRWILPPLVLAIIVLGLSGAGRA
jgi:hypothetical protein